MIAFALEFLFWIGLLALGVGCWLWVSTRPLWLEAARHDQATQDEYRQALRKALANHDKLGHD